MKHTPHPASEDVSSLYERHAQTFDQVRGKALMERAWLDAFLEIVPEALPLLDLGCGSGEPMAQFMIARGRDVTGVDSSAALIALCRTRFPRETWHVGDMRKVALSEKFGGVLAWHSFFHLTPADQRAMFDVFAAHAAPGAALMFTSGPDAGEAIGTFEGEALYHASLARAEYRALLEDRGFEIVRHVVEDQSVGGATIWLARKR